MRLHEAAAKLDADAVKQIAAALGEGESIDAVDNEGHSPMQIAAGPNSFHAGQPAC